MIERLIHMIKMWNQCHHFCLWCLYYDYCKAEKEYENDKKK